MVIMSPLKKRRVAHSAQFCLTDTVFVCWFYWAPYVTIMEESLYTVSYFDSYPGFGPTLDQTSGAPISKVHSRASTVGSTLKGPSPGSTHRATLHGGYGKLLSHFHWMELSEPFSFKTVLCPLSYLPFITNYY